MRFLVDECAGPGLAKWLSEQGHEVYSVFDESRGISDDEIIEKAHEEKWIIVTVDKDFGTKIYRDQHPHCGVILMRLSDERLQMKKAMMEQLLDGYADQLADRFLVVTEDKVRFGSQSSDAK